MLRRHIKIIVTLVLAVTLLSGLCVQGTAAATTVSGDLNGDGSADISDVVLLLQHILFPGLYPVDYPGSTDFSDDGSEDISDVVLLLQYSLFPGIYTIKGLETEPYVYEHVVILGVDGGGSFFREADTPNLDRIFANGSVNYECQCMEPSSSGPCWGSMLHGVLPEYHGVTNDTKVSFSMKSPFPSVFRVVREADPDCDLASFNNWDVINKTLIETQLGVFKVSAEDDLLTDLIVDYLDTHQPKLMFVQFDSVDARGHEYGYGSQTHLNQISTVDSYIGRIYDKMVETGMMENTLIIVSADHGGTPGGDHGGTSKREMEVMIAVAGKNIIKGKMNSTDIRDIAAITLYALGLEKPATYSAKVPGNLFPGVDDTVRVDHPLRN